MPPTVYLWVLGSHVWPEIHAAFGFILCLGSKDWHPWPRGWAHFHDVGPLGGASLGGAFQKWAVHPWCQRGGTWGMEWGVTAAITVLLLSSWEITNPSPGCWSKSPCTSGEIQPFVKSKLLLETVGLWKDLKLCSEVDLDLDPGSVTSCETLSKLITFSES